MSTEFVLFEFLALYGQEYQSENDTSILAGGVGLSLLIVATLLAAATLELAALREERLGIIYTGILGAEVVLIATASFFLFGENFSYREVAGIGLVLVGTALAWA